jgi:hypothetical protein
MGKEHITTKTPKKLYSYTYTINNPSISLEVRVSKKKIK